METETSEHKTDNAQYRDREDHWDVIPQRDESPTSSPPPSPREGRQENQYLPDCHTLVGDILGTIKPQGTDIQELGRPDISAALKLMHTLHLDPGGQHATHVFFDSLRTEGHDNLASEGHQVIRNVIAGHRKAIEQDLQD